MILLEMILVGAAPAYSEESDLVSAQRIFQVDAEVLVLNILLEMQSALQCLKERFVLLA